MWEYNHINGNARGGILMHANHKYVDKFRDAKGNWRYVYDTAKSGASRAASTTASAAKSAYAKAKPVASRAASSVASAAKSAYAKVKPAASGAASSAVESKPTTATENKNPRPNAGNAAAQKNQEASKKAQEVQQKAKADTQKGMKNLESYRKLYMMLSNGSYPMNYVDPVSGKTVTVKDRSGAAQAKANIALAANKVYQDNNKRFSMMNQKDPDLSNMAQQNERVMEMFNSVKKQYIGKETA